MPSDVEYLLLRRVSGEKPQWYAWQGRGYPINLNYDKPQTESDRLSELAGSYSRFLPDEILTLVVALHTDEFLVVVKDLLPIPTYRGPITIRYAVFDQPQDNYVTMTYEDLIINV